MKNTMKFGQGRPANAAAVMAVAAVLFPASAWSADMVIRIRNVAQDSGQIRIAVYEGEGFLRKPVRTESVRASGGMIDVRIKDMPAGTYAVSAFQDTDGNQRLTTNSMGIPEEPYGMSREAKGRYGPPTFDDAKFVLGSEDLVVEVKLARP